MNSIKSQAIVPIKWQTVDIQIQSVPRHFQKSRVPKSQYDPATILHLNTSRLVFGAIRLPLCTNQPTSQPPETIKIPKQCRKWLNLTMEFA